MAQTFEIEWIDHLGCHRVLWEKTIQTVLETWYGRDGTITVKRIDDLHDMPLSISIEDKGD